MAVGHNLISIRDLAERDLRDLVDRGSWYAARPAGDHLPLLGKVVGSYFRVTSTRTRTAFASGALRLGAAHIAFGPRDLQENTGESLEDTARVLAGMLDALVVRTAGDPADLELLCRQDVMPVINAMSSDEHPTQALADLSTLQIQFGRVDGLRVLYVGEGNNTAAALALALSRFTNVELVLCTPPGYGLAPEILTVAADHAAQTKSSVGEIHAVDEAEPGFDVVYTTRWQTTGTRKQDPEWRKAFVPFQVNDDLMKRQFGAMFMHDLPAHRGEEVTASVLDGPVSLAFGQARMKMYSAMAVLDWCVGGGSR